MNFACRWDVLAHLYQLTGWRAATSSCLLSLQFLLVINCSSAQLITQLITDCRHCSYRDWCLQTHVECNSLCISKEEWYKSWEPDVFRQSVCLWTIPWFSWRAETLRKQSPTDPLAINKAEFTFTLGSPAIVTLLLVFWSVHSISLVPISMCSRNCVTQAMLHQSLLSTSKSAFSDKRSLKCVSRNLIHTKAWHWNNEIRGSQIAYRINEQTEQ